MVKQLVSLGADLNVQADTAVGAGTGSASASAGKPRFASTALLEAANQRHGDVVIYLLQQGADPGPLNEKSSLDASVSGSILHLATQLRNEHDARTALGLLLNVDEADLNMKDAGGLTPLAWACASGRISLVLWMILNGE